MKEDALLYVAQKAFIKKGDEVLVINDPKEGLDFPGGKIQEEENDLVESLKREVREETGLEINVGEPFLVWIKTLPDGHKNAGKKVCIISYCCEYSSGEVTLSEEHTAFTWVTESNYEKVNDGTSYFDILKKYFNKN